jgi:glycosyltransferase involved in cell wall biosynthesis
MSKHDCKKRVENHHPAFDVGFPLIDCYCICDTGSTDDTVEVIQSFFKTHSIAGKIVREPFRDFGYNRTFALQECDKMENIDYILLMDADMVLEYNSDSSSSSLDRVKQKLWHHAAHHIFQGSNRFYYKKRPICETPGRHVLLGVTHEYVKVPEGTTYGYFERDELFIADVGDGGSKADKFERDVKLSTDALQKEPNNDRYTFYLANSLRDGGRTQEAIEMYRKRITLGAGTRKSGIAGTAWGIVTKN